MGDLAVLKKIIVYFERGLATNHLTEGSIFGGNFCLLFRLLKRPKPMD
jgi:hypothetical protein